MTDRPTQDVMEAPVRPTGAWIIGGFLLLVIAAVWCLVSFVFLHRAGGSVPS